MSLKFCPKCKTEKEISSFSRNKTKKDGYQGYCRECSRIWRSKNKEYFLLFNKKYYLDNKERLLERNKEYALKNRNDILKQKKKYRQENRDRILKHQKEYYSKENNKNSRNRHEQLRRNSDINYRLVCNLRTRINIAIKSGQKSGSTIRDLGCTIEELKLYLESKFQPGMTWENWTIFGWHIDHIIPLSSFDLSDRDQFLKACHFTNLQPLWAKENISKGDKLI
jgi:hypothetical protein